MSTREDVIEALWNAKKTLVRETSEITSADDEYDYITTTVNQIQQSIDALENED